MVSVYAKRARGLMARFVSTSPAIRSLLHGSEGSEGSEGKNKGKGKSKNDGLYCEQGSEAQRDALVEAIKGFDLEGYAFQAEEKGKEKGKAVHTLVFNRATAPPKKAAAKATTTTTTTTNAKAISKGALAGKKNKAETEVDADGGGVAKKAKRTKK